MSKCLKNWQWLSNYLLKFKTKFLNIEIFRNRYAAGIEHLLLLFRPQKPLRKRSECIWNSRSFSQEENKTQRTNLISVVSQILDFPLDSVWDLLAPVGDVFHLVGLPGEDITQDVVDHLLDRPRTELVLEGGPDLETRLLLLRHLSGHGRNKFWNKKVTEFLTLHLTFCQNHW